MDIRSSLILVPYPLESIPLANSYDIQEDEHELELQHIPNIVHGYRYEVHEKSITAVLIVKHFSI